jgi:hypothetical protein
MGLTVLTMLPAATLSLLADVDIWGIFVACGSLMVIVVAGAGLVMWLRKRLRSDDPGDDSAGFTLGDLRELQRSGHITEEEFRKARDQVVAATQRAMARGSRQKPASGSIGGSPPSSGGPINRNPGG